MNKVLEEKSRGTFAKILNSRKGFTLLELVFSLTIFTLLLTAFFNFYRDALQSWSRESSVMELQQNARIALYDIVRELRYALAVEGLNDERVLPLWKVNGDGAVLSGAKKIKYTSMEGKSCEIAFNEGKNAVTIKIEKGPAVDIALNVVGLDFFRYIPKEDQEGETPLIFVRLTLQANEKGDIIKTSFILESTVRLQNIS